MVRATGTATIDEHTGAASRGPHREAALGRLIRVLSAAEWGRPKVVRDEMCPTLFVLLHVWILLVLVSCGSGLGRVGIFDRNQKQAIGYRDQYCKCGCGLLARHCDIEHRIEWTDDGLTNIENGDPRCRRSHTIKTEHHKQKRKQQPHPDNNPDPP